MVLLMSWLLCNLSEMRVGVGRMALHLSSALFTVVAMSMGQSTGDRSCLVVFRHPF